MTDATLPMTIGQVEQGNGAPDDYYICLSFAKDGGQMSSLLMCFVSSPWVCPWTLSTSMISRMSMRDLQTISIHPLKLSKGWTKGYRSCIRNIGSMPSWVDWQVPAWLPSDDWFRSDFRLTVYLQVIADAVHSSVHCLEETWNKPVTRLSRDWSGSLQKLGEDSVDKCGNKTPKVSLGCFGYVW